jgi:hypothetical protein
MGLMRRLRALLARPWLRRRLAATATLAIVVAVVLVLALRGQSSPPAVSSGAAMSGAGVTTVRRRDLVQTNIQSGTLGYADPRTVFNRLTGTITWLPAVGRVIRPGQVLYRVADQAVVLMDGATPAYRDLGPDDAPGPDIEQLNRNLVRLGFDSDAIVVDDEWQAATSAGVDLLQESLGEAETGILTLGQVVFLPGPQLVSSIDATAGGTGSSAGGSSAADANTPDPPAAERVSLDAPDHPGTEVATTAPLRTVTTITTTTTETTTASAPPAPPPAGYAGANRPAYAGANRPGGSRGLRFALNRLSSQVAALERELRTRRNHATTSHSHHDAGVSVPDPAATAILQTSSPSLVVTVDLPAGSQSEAAAGATVTVQLPAGNTVAGKIISVGSVAQSGSSSDGSSSSTVPVTVRLNGHRTGSGLDQAAVSVAFVQSRARHVLSVPVTALVATSGQTYALQRAAAPHALVAVRTGLFAAGYVQVSGAGVVAGLRVTNSEG